MNTHEEYIISAFNKLNEALKDLNNEIIVLDFSHFSPCDNSIGNQYDIYFKSLASTERYRSKYFNYISSFVNDSGSIWRKYEIGKQRLLYNFDNDNSEAEEFEKGIFQNEELEKANVKVQNNFDAEIHLIEEFSQSSSLPGKCFIIYSEEHGDAQSIVYVLLKEKISFVSREEGMMNLLAKLPESLKGFDTELHTLLIHEMVNSLVEEKASLYKQVQDLKTQTMFSLTTHSLKTHLNTTVIKEKNAFLDKLQNHDELKEDFQMYLGKEVDTLFRLTEVLSLVDKIKDKRKFIDAAKGTALLSESMVTYNLENHLIQFNRRKNIERTEPDIKICSTSSHFDCFQLPIKLYGLYLGKDLMELFFNTIFENIVVYGKPESGYRNLAINTESNKIVFSNKTKDKTVQIDETSLTGNYRLFKKLLEDTSSGTLSIPPVSNHEFKIIITYE